MFRFLVEFVRGNEVVWLGLTRVQLVLAVTIPLVLLRIGLQWSRGRYRDAFAPSLPVQLVEAR